MASRHAHAGARGPVTVLASREVRGALRSRLFLVALAMLVLLAILSVTIGAVAVHRNVADYRQAADALRNLGRTDIPPMPTLNPIAVSKTFINYLAMIGALLAMILGLTSFAEERAQGTASLVLVRPVFRDQVLTGKVVAHASLLGTLMLAVGLATWLALRVIGGVALSGDEVVKLFLTMGMSWLYLMTFYLLAVVVSLAVDDTRSALMLTIILWLVLAFVLPQIGDTMDLDNQIPGGFFASLGLDKAGEQAALAHFRWYETVRDGVEELSPTKHYERISFALLGIKQEFAASTWPEILRMKWVNLVGLIAPPTVLLGAAYMLFLRKEL